MKKRVVLKENCEVTQKVDGWVLILAETMVVLRAYD